MPDFRIQPTFPIATVIDAAQRNAQLQEQSREAGNKSLIEGLQSIGQVGQSLYDTKKRVAQSLSLGRQFDIPDEVSKTMDPSQVLQVGAIKKGQVDMNLLLNLLHPGSGGTAPVVPTATPISTTPSSTPTTPSTKPNGAILASDVTTTPIPETTPSGSLPPTTTGQTPVPIAAPPAKPPMLNAATISAAAKMGLFQRPEPVITQADALAAGSVPKGTRIITPQTDKEAQANKKEQDQYWRDAVRGLQSIRGDAAMKDIETQRNSAITAYNRLRDIEYTGKAPNPIDYVDILGQIYKARTGQAPGEIVLKDAKQATSIGQLGKFWTFATGQQMPATSKDIASSLKDMVAHMGLQADNLHDGYMQVHGAGVFNPNMSEENQVKLSKLSRGKSFSDATGIKPEDFDPHVQAIQWAQAHPNDPRSAPILQKAMQAKQAQGGGSIGL